MSRDKLLEARKLIEAKRFEEGAAVLRSLPNDPTAQKWLAQLELKGVVPPASADNELAALRASLVNPTERKESQSLFPMFVGTLMVLIVILQGLIVYVVVDSSVSLKDSLNFTEPVDVHGRVSIDDTVEVTGTVKLDSSSSSSTINAVERALQEWEYLTVNYSQADSYVKEGNGRYEWVSSNDFMYDLALFGDYICNPFSDTDSFEECDAKFQGQAFYLNLWGEDGWELVSVNDKSTSYIYSVEMIFKRPKTSTSFLPQFGNPGPAASRDQTTSAGVG